MAETWATSPLLTPSGALIEATAASGGGAVEPTSTG